MVTDSTWDGFVDAFGTRVASPQGGLLAVHDVDLQTVLDSSDPLRVVLTGGAGQLAGPVDFCTRNGLGLGAVETTLRDLDDPAGNARRVVTTALDLPDDTRLHVRVSDEPTYAWLQALDVLAEVPAVVALPLDRLDPAPWIDAALDRELAVSLVGGTAAQAGGALRETARLWGDPDDLAAARRWCRSWLTDDAPSAVAGLTAWAAR